LKVIKRLDSFVIPFSLAAIGGFDIAWTLMKNPRIDMAFNTGLMIPAGLLIGLLVGGAKAWFGFRIPRSITIAALVAVGLFSIMPFLQIMINPHAASIVVPILIRDGLMARGINSAVFLWAAFLFLVSSLTWSVFYLVRQRESAVKE